MDASSCIRHFCALVQGLGPEARAIWDGCTRRTFDIGFEARWQSAAGKLPADQDFFGTEIDLGGMNYLATFNIRF